MVVIYRQEIINDISLFTSQPKATFYDELFLKLDLSFVPHFSNSKGRKGFDNHSMIAAFIVMKCEGFAFITDLIDYLNNNLLIAHYCGFDISKPLPSYWSFERFIKNIDHDILSHIMQSQVLKAFDLELIDASFIGLDSTPISANTGVRNFFCKLSFYGKIIFFSGQGIRPAPATIYHKNSGMSRAPIGRSLKQLAA